MISLYIFLTISFVIIIWNQPLNVYLSPLLSPFLRDFLHEERILWFAYREVPFSIYLLIWVFKCFRISISFGSSLSLKFGPFYSITLKVGELSVNYTLLLGESYCSRLSGLIIRTACHCLPFMKPFPLLLMVFYDLVSVRLL